MIFTDGKRTVDILISNLRTGEEWSEDFFAGRVGEGAGDRRISRG